MIHAFNFCGQRDRQLSDLMETTLKKYAGKYLGSFTVRDMDAAGYGNGAGWEAAMMKLDAMRWVVNKKKVKDDDWVLSVDSDVVFCSFEVFIYLRMLESLIYNKSGIVGILQVGPLAKCKMGDLYNFSGCSIYLRGNIARAITSLSPERLSEVRLEFKEFVICENEDVVISYLAQSVGAAPVGLPNHLFHSDYGFEHDLKAGTLCSFYHLNYPMEVFKDGKFMDVPVTGKWDIPKALRRKKIVL